MAGAEREVAGRQTVPTPGVREVPVEDLTAEGADATASIPPSETTGVDTSGENTERGLVPKKQTRQRPTAQEGRSSKKSKSKAPEEGQEGSFEQERVGNLSDEELAILGCKTVELGGTIGQEVFKRLGKASADLAAQTDRIAELRKARDELRAAIRPKDAEIKTLQAQLQAQERELTEEKKEREQEVRNLQERVAELEANVAARCAEAVQEYKASGEFAEALKVLLVPILNHGYTLGVDEARSQFPALALDALPKRAYYKQGMDVAYTERARDFRAGVDIVDKYVRQPATASGSAPPESQKSPAPDS